MENLVSIGIDIGGTNIKIGIISSLGKTIFKKSIPTDTNITNSQLIHKLIDLIRTCLDNLPNRYQLSGIGIGFPGTVVSIKGILKSATNLPRIKELKIVDILHKELLKLDYHFPIYINNDGNCAALGQFYFTKNKKDQNVATITLGTGIGGGLILNGQLFEGNGNAFEVGHIPINHIEFGKANYYPLCGCGKYGCIEAYASANSIPRVWQHINNQKQLNRENYTRNLTAQDIYYLAKKNDTDSLEVFKIAGTALGILATNLIQILNINVITFTGGLANAADLLEPIIIQTIQNKCMPELVQNVKIIFVDDSESLGTKGAAALSLINTK